MHDFNYKNGELYCEGVRVSDIVRRVGSPVYIYSHKTLTEHVEKLQRAFKPVKPLICFAMKANANLSILRTLVKKGAGIDLVSGGELFRAKKAGCPPERMVYAGVGKTDEEIADAIRTGILLFNAESRPELERIELVARKMKRKVNVSLRVNPDVDAETHAHITTGKKESKFGIDLDAAREIFADKYEYPHLKICGIHVHIGSQITKGEPFVKAFQKVLDFISSLEKAGHKIEFLNLGGGLGIIYSDEKPQTADEFAKKILPLFKGRKYRLIFEPGRFIVGNAGIFVTQVIYVKKTKAKNFAIVDGGMNDLIRPALYDSFHDVWPLVKNGKTKTMKYDVVGPICESGDFLAKGRELQELDRNDLIALASAGAYGFAMSSNYNARPRVAEVLVKGSRFDVIRRRENYDDLIQGEKIPSWLK